MENLCLIRGIFESSLLVITQKNHTITLEIKHECMWFEFLKFLRKFDTVFVDKNSLQTKKITDASTFIIEPHYLVAATQIVDAYTCPRKVYVKHVGASFIADKRRIIEGNLVHSIFSQRMALNIPLKNAIQNSLNEQQIDILCNDIDPDVIEKYLELNTKPFATIMETGESEINVENWKFGITGKIDGKIDDMLIELKTSQLPEDKIPYFSHNLQINLYLLMLNEVKEHFGRIMYVNNGQMDFVTPSKLDTKKLLAARNYCYLVKSGRFIPQILRGDAKRKCIWCFVKEGCKNLCAGLETQRDCAVCYHSTSCKQISWKKPKQHFFTKFTNALNSEENEHIRHKYYISRGGTDNKKAKSLLKKNGLLIATNKKLSEKIISTGKVRTIYSHSTEITTLRVGDFVTVFPLNCFHDVVTTSYSAQISELTGSELSLNSFSILGSKIVILSAQNPWQIRNSRSAIYRSMNLSDTISFIVNSQAKKIELNSFSYKEYKLIQPLKQYNKFQEKAIKQGVCTPDILVIQGPAGTGKTSVIIEIIRQLQFLKKSVLVSAFTNMAVDSIALKLQEAKVQFSRLGRKLSTNPAIHSHLAMNHVSEFKAMFNRKSTQTLLSTSSTLSNERYKDMIFDYVLIDEAAQMTEPDTLKPLLLAKKAILVGDHKQLPAIIISDKAKKLGLHISLFERLVPLLPKSRFVFLVEQYRMNDEILHFPNQEFYNGKLISADKIVGTQKLKPIETPLLNNLPYTVIKLKSLNLKKSSQVNLLEIWITIILVNDLLEVGIQPSEIGIITPYRAQVAKLRQFIPKISVDTIDRYQGSEKEIIIFSSVINTEIPIIGEPRRINVALTRAKKKLIVLISEIEGAQNHLFTRLIKNAEKRKLLIKIDKTSDDISTYFNYLGYPISAIQSNLTKFLGTPNLKEINTRPYFSTSLNLNDNNEMFFGTMAIMREEFVDTSMCYICFEELKDGVQCYGCFKKFHQEHLLQWVESNANCPYCKVTLVLKKLGSVFEEIKSKMDSKLVKV